MEAQRKRIGAAGLLLINGGFGGAAGMTSGFAEDTNSSAPPFPAPRLCVNHSDL